MKGYLYFDWVGNLDDQISTTGYAFGIGSGIVSWSSKNKPTISLSSTEEEYKALCVATCEAIWLRRLVQNVGKEKKGTYNDQMW